MNDSQLVYALVDPDTKQMRYIGMSCSALHRPMKHMSVAIKHDRAVSAYMLNWLRRLIRESKAYEIRVLERGFENRKALADAETFYIDFWKRLGHCDINMKRGGIGGWTGWNRGKKHSAETLAKLSKALTGLLSANKGNRYTMTEEQCEHKRQGMLAAWASGKRSSQTSISDEHKKAISNASKGVPRAPHCSVCRQSGHNRQTCRSRGI